MALTPRQKRALLGASHAIKPALVVGAERVTDAVVEQLRQAFAGRELLKVRVGADDRATCETVAADLVDRVPCELVRRVGRVLVLYRPGASDAPGDDGLPAGQPPA